MRIPLFSVALGLALYSMNWNVVLEEHQTDNPSVRISLYPAQLEEEDHGTGKIENVLSCGETTLGDDYPYLHTRLGPCVCLNQSLV